MEYPRIVIKKSSLAYNVRELVKICRENNMTVAGTTKVVCGDPILGEIMIDNGIEYLADSRIENLKVFKNYDIEKMLLRSPMISEIEDLVEFVDISLNSNYFTIEKINEEALKRGKKHKLVLMIDSGDLREGYYSKEDLYEDIEAILKLSNVEIYGLGQNYLCFGGLIPEEERLRKLSQLKEDIKRDFNIDIKLLTGGNSGNMPLIEEGITGGTNNVRLGEALFLGTEPAYRGRVKNTLDDVFTLEAQIIEIKDKPSVPIGKIGLDAFGNKPEFVDRGIRKKIICAIGKQDMELTSLKPFDKDLIILGGSSDHLIIDGGDSKKDYKIGDILKFKLSYVGLLRGMTSKYIKKVYIE